jgi:hypothetical protein
MIAINRNIAETIWWLIVHRLQNKAHPRERLILCQITRWHSGSIFGYRYGCDLNVYQPREFKAGQPRR